MDGCGVCEGCIEFELTYLSHIEHELWIESAGDVTKYLDCIGLWIDMFNEQQGIKP